MNKTVYYIRDCIVGTMPVIVSSAQLARYFANSKIQDTFVLNSWLDLDEEALNSLADKKYKKAHVYLNVYRLENPHDLCFWRDQFGTATLHGSWSEKVELNQGDLINLILQGQKFYHDKTANEKWSGQVRYLYVTNELGHALKVPIKDVAINFRHHEDRHVPHSSGFYIKSINRAEHARSNFAKSNYATIRHYDINRKYFHCLRHMNRNYVRHHLEHFPAWDDDEYLTSRHSTGWKHQRKNKRQYWVPLSAHFDTIKKKKDWEQEE